MTNTEPRGPIRITRPSRDGQGWSRTWQRTIGGARFAFTAVVMPLTGELRYFAQRLRPEYADAPQFDCGWERLHDITVAPTRPLKWRRMGGGNYVVDAMVIRRDPNASADNRWSLRRPGMPPTGHRLLKSAQAAAARHLARAAADRLIELLDHTERYQTCTFGTADLTMGRPRAHGGDVGTYVFPANGETAELCEGHADAYGDLAKPVRRPATVYARQPQQQSAQADQPLPSDAARAEGLDPTPSVTVVSPEDYMSKTAQIVDWLVARISITKRSHEWVASLPGGQQVVDAGLVGYAIETGAAKSRKAGTVEYLTLPFLNGGDVVTITPRRDGRQFDVLTDPAGIGMLDGMVRVTPRNPKNVDDGPRWVGRTYVRHVAPADVEPYQDDDEPAEQVSDVVLTHAARTGQTEIEAEHDLRDRAEDLDPDMSGPNEVLVERGDGDELRETRHAAGGYRALLVRTDDSSIKLGARVEELRAIDDGVLARATNRAARAYRGLMTDYREACHAGNTERASMLGDALKSVRENAVSLGVDVDEIDREITAPTVADMLMPAMPQQYRDALTWMLAPYGFAPPAGVDLLVGDDANPDPFLVHDPTGLALGVHERHLRMSYPAVHAGEGDGDIGTAWFDLAYGTSFETVTDIAAGLAFRLRLRVTPADENEQDEQDEPITDPAGAMPCGCYGTQRDHTCTTMGAGNVAVDDEESLVFADESIPGEDDDQGEPVDATEAAAAVVSAPVCGCKPHKIFAHEDACRYATVATVAEPHPGAGDPETIAQIDAWLTKHDLYLRVLTKAEAEWVVTRYHKVMAEEHREAIAEWEARVGQKYPH